MVEIQIGKEGFEVLASTNERVQSTRFACEVVHDQQPDPDAELRVGKTGIEVLADLPPSVKCTRLVCEVVHDQQPDPDAELQVGKTGIEVVAQMPPGVKCTRLVCEVVHDQQPDPDAEMQIGKMALEILGRSFTPLDTCQMPDFWKYFSHNFATRFTLETQCRTAVSRGAESLAEDRTQLFQRPRRVASVRWSEKGSDTQQNLMDLIQVIRSCKTNNWVIPLYCDAGVLTVDALTGATILQGRFERRRFFIGGRVAVVRLRGPAGEVQDDEGNLLGVHETVIHDKPDSDKLEFIDPIPFNVQAGMTCVVPMMCVHPRLEDKIRQYNSRLWDIKLEFEERGGPTAIPFFTSDIPPGFDVYRDRPIFKPRHDYSNPLNIEIFQEGSQTDQGRDLATYTRGASQRIKHKIQMFEERTPGWEYIQFFESRRGRCRFFWLIDQEDLFTLTDLETDFINVAKLGSFVEFQKDMEYFGFMMKDGTCFVREISTIQELPQDWRLTVVDTLPAGLDFADVCLAGRARPTRMLEDTFEEEWFHGNAVKFSVSTISLLNEETITLDP